jgi:hypothetical protein
LASAAMTINSFAIRTPGHSLRVVGRSIGLEGTLAQRACQASRGVVGGRSETLRVPTRLPTQRTKKSGDWAYSLANSTTSTRRSPDSHFET